MKTKLFFIILSSIFIFQLTAQLSFKEDSLYLVESPPPELEVVVKNFLYNNSTETVTYKWWRTVEEIPSSWETSVCDETQCWAPFVTSNSAVLIDVDPGDSTILDVHFYNEGRVGEGYVEVIAFDVADSANTVITAKYFGKAENDPNVSISSIEKNSFDIYPNPARNIINLKGLDNTSSNAKIEIYSIIGVKVAEENLKNKAIDVSNLQKGVYVLQVSDNLNNYSQTFIKQ